MENASPVSRQRGCGERDDGLGAGRLDRGQDAELVTAHPVRVADSVHRGREALAEAGEERVAGRVAERVVVLLEAVEVEECEHDTALAAGVRQLGIEIVDQSPPVGKPRQRVGACFFMAGGGHSRVLAGEALGDGAGERGTSVEERECQCEQEDCDCRALRGPGIGSRRTPVVLAARLVEGGRNTVHVLRRDAREVICALAVVGTRSTDRIDLVKRGVVGPEWSWNPSQRGHRRAAPQLDEGRGDLLLAVVHELAGKLGRASRSRTGFERRALQLREVTLERRELQLRVATGARALLEHYDRADRGKAQQQDECRNGLVSDHGGSL